MEFNKKPLIGIVMKPLLSHQVTKTLWKRLIVNDEIRQLVVLNGGIPIGIMPKSYAGNSDTSNMVEHMSEEDKSFLFAALDVVDGIILQGGLTSDTYEMEIVRYAIENNIPIIGICAGFNNIARAMGIQVILKKELSSIHDVYNTLHRHNVTINKKHTLFSVFNTETYAVNSLHSMFIENDNLPSDIEVLATSIDEGIEHVEAFTISHHKLCLAIKWHPELMMNDQISINIFKYLINACKT